MAGRLRVLIQKKKLIIFCSPPPVRPEYFSKQSEEKCIEGYTKSLNLETFFVYILKCIDNSYYIDWDQVKKLAMKKF